VKVEEPMSMERLTQSTHAHLLSFAMLFALTGLAFAFTSYPGVVRCVVAPLALVAIVTDVAFWWLARLSDGYGVYFAMGVVGTGGVVAAALTAQIVLSVWNMYGPKGKVVLVLMFLLGGTVGGLVYTNLIHPALLRKKHEIEEARIAASKPAPVPEPGPKSVPAPAEVPRFVKMLQFPLKGPDGKEVPVTEMKWGREHDGGMVRAFFDKDSAEFAKALKKADAEAQRLLPERHGELAAIIAWSKLDDPARRTAFDADAFDPPADLKGKPFTEGYLADGKVKVKSLLADRCFRCHDGASDDEAPFGSYDDLREYFKPPPK
jgi:hypothetical protein